MKPRRTYWTSCKGKRRYTKVRHAINDARELGRKTGEHFSFYHCKFCGYVHVGHTPWQLRNEDRRVQRTK